MNKGSFDLNLRAKCNVELPTLSPSMSNAPSISGAPSVTTFPSASVMPVTFYTLDPTYYPTQYPTETPQCLEKNQPCGKKEDCCKKKMWKEKGEESVQEISIFRLVYFV